MTPVTQYTIALGNVFTGIRLFGVFIVPDDANYYAANHFTDQPWEVVPIGAVD